MTKGSDKPAKIPKNSGSFSKTVVLLQPLVVALFFISAWLSRRLGTRATPLVLLAMIIAVLAVALMFVESGISMSQLRTLLHRAFRKVLAEDDSDGFWYGVEHSLLTFAFESPFHFACD